MNRFKKHFAVDSVPLFLAMNFDSEQRSISMRVQEHVQEGKWSDVFLGLMSLPTTEIQISQHAPNTYISPTVIRCLNRVGQTSRRAMGNVLFVGEKAYDFFDTAQLPQHLQGTKKILVREFEGNDVIAAYQKVSFRPPSYDDDRIAYLLEQGGSYEKAQEVRDEYARYREKYPNGFTYIDGPMGAMEDRVYLNENWKNYFHKVRLIRD